MDESQSPYRVNWFVILYEMYDEIADINLSQSPYRVNWFVILKMSISWLKDENVSIPLSGQLVCNLILEICDDVKSLNPLIGSIGL